MGAVAGIGMGMQALGAGWSAGAAYASGEYNKAVHDYNANVAEMQSIDAIQRGEQDVVKVRRAGRKAIGSQRAGFAAQGIDVNEGTASVLQEQSAAAMEEDVATVRNNAKREAWGYQVRATNEYNEGRFARYKGRTEAVGTILGGAGKMIPGG